MPNFAAKTEKIAIKEIHQEDITCYKIYDNRLNKYILVGNSTVLQ